MEAPPEILAPEWFPIEEGAEKPLGIEPPPGRTLAKLPAPLGTPEFILGLPALPGVNGAERVGIVEPRTAIVDDWGPTPAGRLAAPDAVTARPTPTFCRFGPTLAAVAGAFATRVDDLVLALPATAVPLPAPAKVLPELRPERFPAAVLVPARLPAT